ncbi:acetyl-CoA carboxylase biotin carboxylase subunit [candidate division NPL-UPA2 bacterium]|nr:acetyl-CoA carboxylase biotin carboxylase subunit [candidate division NPL-UPA2 bacterium]
MFSKILIANRGEIALRIIRACKELEIKTVAVHSEADRDSLHVRYADEDVCIGRGESSASYLHIPSIISAAEITDVEAIHPGYGFLAENAHFAEICESCRIKFIGPRPEVIRRMGDKALARETMARSGLPIISGSSGIVKNKEKSLEITSQIGYPVIIKAAAGGGGRGIRVAHNEASFVNAFFMAQAEAESAFGRADVYLEKYIENPRHIEFQLLADEQGNIIHLGERDCTIQRRYQKLVEESPSPALDEEIRKKMWEAALRGAKSVNYTSLGTMEFLLDKDKNFYFLEMNTQLQVEHSVTELVTGIDLVKEQIRLASGEQLGYGQEDVQWRGSAIECQINAEDPDDNFSPCPGKITGYNMPGGPGVRVDTHIYPEYVIPPLYDSLIAKLATHGRTREETIRRMERALEECVIEGVKTTIPFHRAILSDPDFIDGDFSTDFVEHLLARGE